MRVLIAVLSLIVAVNGFALEFKDTNGYKCKLPNIPSYLLNAQVTDKVGSKATIKQDSYGFAAVGVVELSEEGAPLFGRFLDVCLKKVKTSKGVDYWKEVGKRVNN